MAVPLFGVAAAPGHAQASSMPRAHPKRRPAAPDALAPPPQLFVRAQECAAAAEKLHVQQGRNLGGCPYVDIRKTQKYVIENGKPEKNHYLLVPTRRITGIESAYLRSKAKPPKHYWDNAWKQAQAKGATPVKKPANMIGLGINAKYSIDVHHPVRTQDQLHIHMETLLGGVRKSLDSHDKEITDKPSKWKDSIVPVEGSKGKKWYRVLRVKSLNRNLFKLLYDNVVRKEKNGTMANQMMAAARRTKGGFYVLNSEATLSGFDGTSSIQYLLVYR